MDDGAETREQPAADGGAWASPAWSDLQSLGPGWASALGPATDALAAAADRVRDLVADGAHVLPRPDDVLRALRHPFDAVRVVVVGQDPYPTPGHATGLSFSTGRDVRPLPRSLRNVLRELADDVAVHRTHGDLTGWADQGVLLLNRVLTVTAGTAGSHHGLGWEDVTAQAVRALAVRGGPLVAVLWGRPAQRLRPLLGDVPAVVGPHPSPLSAHRGFFGSRPFSQADRLLTDQGGIGVDWAAD